MALVFSLEIFVFQKKHPVLGLHVRPGGPGLSIQIQ